MLHQRSEEQPEVQLLRERLSQSAVRASNSLAGVELPSPCSYFLCSCGNAFAMILGISSRGADGYVAFNKTLLTRGVRWW